MSGKNWDIIVCATCLITILVVICGFTVKQKVEIREVIKEKIVNVVELKEVPEKKLSQDCSKRGGEYMSYANYEKQFVAYCKISTTTEYIIQ